MNFVRLFFIIWIVEFLLMFLQIICILTSINVRRFVIFCLMFPPKKRRWEKWLWTLKFLIFRMCYKCLFVFLYITLKKTIRLFYKSADGQRLLLHQHTQNQKNTLKYQKYSLSQLHYWADSLFSIMLQVWDDVCCSNIWCWLLYFVVLSWNISC